MYSIHVAGGGGGNRSNDYDSQRNIGSWDDFGSASGTKTKATDDDEDWDAPPKTTAADAKFSTGAPASEIDDWDSPSSADKSVNKGAPPHMPSGKVAEADDWDTPVEKTSYNQTASCSRGSEAAGDDEWETNAGNQESTLSTVKAVGNVPTVEVLSNCSLTSSTQGRENGEYEKTNLSHVMDSNGNQPVSSVEDVGERVTHSLIDKSKGTITGIGNLNTGVAELESDVNSIKNCKENTSAKEVHTASNTFAFIYTPKCSKILVPHSAEGSEVRSIPTDTVLPRSETLASKVGGSYQNQALTSIARSSHHVVRFDRPENTTRTEPARVMGADKSMPSPEEDEWA